MRGRLPSGPEYVDQLPGSAQAKKRLKVVLETLAGTCRVQEGCQRLQVSEPRFQQLRLEVLEAGLARLEPRAAGRPAQTPSPAEQEIAELKARLAELELELKVGQVREEIALALPNVVRQPSDNHAEAAASNEPEKKNAPATAPAPSAGPVTDFEEAHMKRLHELCRLSSAAILDLARRNDSRQLPHRLLERDVRVGAVNLADEIIDQGYTRSEAAGLLKLCPRTLRQWQIDGRNRCVQVALLGRPLLRSSVYERHQVLDLLTELGPATGLPTLRQCFPLLARAELADLLCRYRRLWRDLHVRLVHCLRWPVPGRVWAMDFSDPPRPIDGRYPHLLAVRDLASGQQLLWLPVPNLTALVAQDALASLVACHGAPLVLKIDNGSAFIDATTLAWLCQLAVIPLFSPAYMPQYNGSVEAGNGSLKTRTETQATRAGHPGYWTWDDAEAARLQANATSRPRGETGPTPDELWAQRQPISTQERDTFQAVLQRRRLEARQEAATTIDQTLDPSEHRSLDRQAIRRALGELGYLLLSRRRIPLPIRNQKVTELS